MTTPLAARIETRTFRPGRGARAAAMLGVLGRPVPRAILRAMLTIYVATTLTFFIIRLMPGNPIDIYISELMQEHSISQEEAAQLAGGSFAIDLDAPMHEQYLSFLGNLARGDMGSSLLSKTTTVTGLILQFLPWTIFIVGLGLALSFTVGVGIGLLAAYRRGSVFDHAVSSIGSFISSIPDFLIALMLVLFLGIQLRLLPITEMRGSTTPGIPVALTPESIYDILFHAFLPVLTFFLGTLGTWILSMKNATLAALDEDHVTVARARGLTDGRITTAYVGRNAIIPLVSQLALSSGVLVGGAIIVEQIFVYQGVGLLLLKAIGQRDYPVMQGCILLVTSAVVIANLFADLLYSRLDPRIGRAGGAAEA